jgi:hypothetical protein
MFALSAKRVLLWCLPLSLLPALIIYKVYNNHNLNPATRVLTNMELLSIHFIAFSNKFTKLLDPNEYAINNSISSPS